MSRINMRRSMPLAYAPALTLEAYARTHNDKKLNELVKIRASTLNRCGYCLARHIRDATILGESQDRIDALSDTWQETGLWSPAEEAALELTDQLTQLGDVGVSDSVWDKVVFHFGEKGAGNLIMAITAINVWNRIAVATGMEADDL